ncbi:thermonuclease family protein [Ensifer sp. BR816]|uniref:thermonuclease family protein n=1 Tax=Rhizobium sp. (strain BR816) TaxID=1057002 RepID=UPI00039DFCCC|nr:hypothetical protein [Ensifer sp. BR816]
MFANEPVIGHATIIDGDKGERIRLHGVDAPENWNAARMATAASTATAKRRHSHSKNSWQLAALPCCEFLERGRNDRFVGVCFRADGREVSRWFVENANAVDSERHRKGAYVGAQEGARSQRQYLAQQVPVALPSASRAFNRRDARTFASQRAIVPHGWMPRRTPGRSSRRRS